MPRHGWSGASVTLMQGTLHFASDWRDALCLLLSGSALGIEAQTVSIIPKPAQMSVQGGTLTLTDDMAIAYDAACKEQAEYLLQTVRRSTGFRWKEAGKKSRAGIVLEIDTLRVPAPEGYTLEVSGKRIAICGHDKGGVFYGIQSLLQLLPPAIYSASLHPEAKWSVPCLQLADAPDHPWRGMMLDVARYFYDKDFVKKYIDMMAMYKMNKLQFHLIDIQLADLDLAVKLLVKLLKDRCLHAAGSAPSCPEVDQHEAGGGDGIKIVLCKMHNSHVIYLLCYSLLI